MSREATIWAVDDLCRDPALVSATVKITRKQAKIVEDGGTAGFGYKKIIALDDLDFTPRAAIERYVAKKKASAASHRERADRLDHQAKLARSIKVPKQDEPSSP